MSVYHEGEERRARPLKKVSCPICDRPSEPKRIFRTSKGIGIWKCPDCRIMYASPRFTEDSLLDIYEQDDFVDRSFYEDWSYERWKGENRHRTYVTQCLKLDLLSRFLGKGDRVLDAGCGTGLFCLEAEKRGFSVEGIEPSANLVELGRRTLKVPIRRALLEEFDPEYLYRGIVLWDVLEHVPDPVGMIRRCRILMESGGYLFLQVPNSAGLSNRMKTFLCRTGLKNSDFKHFGLPGHLYSFNRQSITALLRAGGFRPVFFESWSHRLKDGSEGPLDRLVISVSRSLCLSDYVTCVGRCD